jgi:hypothetical protein
MYRVVALLSLSLMALDGWAHPGHPAFDPNHSHGLFESEPFLLLAVVTAVVIAMLTVGTAAYRRSRARK